jgi:hypothetical protein
MSDLDRITAAEVSDAEAEVERCRQTWERWGYRVVSEEELHQADRLVGQALEGIRRLHSPKYHWLRFQWLTLRGSRAVLGGLGLSDIHWLLAGALLAVPAFGLAGLALAVVTGQLGITLAFAIAAYLVVWVGLACVLRGAWRVGLDQEVIRLREELAARARSLSALRERLAGRQKVARELWEVREAQRAYEWAYHRHEQLSELLASRRYQLLHGDWRSLRGIPFEEFCADIFEELGYRAEPTRTTGDQGADLIVTGKGRRIAVQTKGYEGSVGNKAVQEVYAGMAFYRCTSCMVLTNSAFTPAAFELAHAVDCRLIDGQRLPDLIEGRIL